MKPDISSESRFLPTPPAFDASVRRVPVGYRHAVWYEISKIMWLPDGEKKFDDKLICFDRMYERDGHTQTDRQTPHDSIGRACKASRGKN